MTAPSMAAVPETASPDRTLGRNRFLSGLEFPVRQLAGVGFTLVLALLLELLRRPAGVEPVALVPLLVVGATMVGGFVGGTLAAATGTVYAVFYYSHPEWIGVAGNSARVAITVVGAAGMVSLVGLLRDRLDRTPDVTPVSEHPTEGVREFTAALSNEPEESLAAAIVDRAAQLLDADLVALTIVDPQTDRHYVRGVRGAAASGVGIEIVPGVGITGQALRERRTVVGASAVQSSGRGPDSGTPARNGAKASGTRVVAAVPAMHGGRVIAIVTVGRSDAGRPFDAADIATLSSIGPIVTLAVSGTLMHNEVEPASPRDPQTGLFNRAYLDAALEQLLALRRRSPAEERPPLSIIMFDIDGFRPLNERNGSEVGDRVLRSVSTLLRQRFRASDILARVGADSFLVVLNGADPGVALAAATEIRRKVGELNLTNSRAERVVVSVSAACTLFRDGELPEPIFRSVEAALDAARLSGPGAVVSI